MILERHGARAGLVAMLRSLLLALAVVPMHAMAHGIHEDGVSADHAGHLHWAGFGNSHGDIAVSANGEIYVSVVDDSGGMLVFDGDGRMQRRIEGYPSDVHGFLIREEDGREVIYATQRYGDAIIYKTDLDGNVLLEVPKSALPEEQFWLHPRREQLMVAATSIAVAPDGTIFVVTGYGGDRIHRFNADGSYIDSWDGQSEEYGLRQAHKIYLDERYSPPRLLVTDRKNLRLVHLSLEGQFLGTFAEELRRPSAVVFRGEHVAVAEIDGRVSILDASGQIVSVPSENLQAGRIGTNKVPPEEWPEGTVISPHGIAFAADGDLLVTEWSQWGRVLKFALPAQ